MRQIVKLTWEWPLATHHHPSLKGHLLGKKTICYHKGHQLSKTTVIIVPPPSPSPSYKKAIKIHTWNMTNFPLPWDDFYYDIYSSFISPSPSWILIKTAPPPNSMYGNFPPSQDTFHSIIIIIIYMTCMQNGRCQQTFVA